VFAKSRTHLPKSSNYIFGLSMFNSFCYGDSYAPIADVETSLSLFNGDFIKEFELSLLVV
jgi:hypothetical protein